MTTGGFGRTLGKAVLRRLGRGISRLQEQRPVPADLLESETEYLLVFDAPGATASDVTVEYHDSVVEVRIDRFREFHEGYDVVFPGRGLELTGRKTLPPDADVDPDAARAEVRDDGTLRVTVPKADGG